MSVDISILDFEPRIEAEYPENSLSVTVDTGNASISLFFKDIEDWWKFRQAVRKKEFGYRLHTMGGTTIMNRAEADAWCNEFYRSSAARAIAAAIPTNSEDAL